MKGIDCHLCYKRMREAGLIDGIFYFMCDNKTCPVDEYQIRVVLSSKQVGKGMYLSSMRI